MVYQDNRMSVFRTVAAESGYKYIKKTEVLTVDFLIPLLSVIPLIICLEYKMINKTVPLYKVEYHARMVCILLLILLIRELYYEDILFFLYFSIIIMSSFLNGRDIMVAVNTYSGVVLITVFLIVVAGSSSERAMQVFNTWKWLMFILLLMDLASFVLYPDGMFREESGDWVMTGWFLGYKTFRLIIYMPLSFLFAYTSFLKKKRIDLLSFLVFALCIIGTIRCNAGSATAALLFCLICLILVNIANKADSPMRRLEINTLLNYKIWIPAFLVISYLTCFVQWRKLMDALEEWFDRSYSLTARLVLWERTVELIMKKPILGYGVMTANEIENYIGYRNTHNLILTVLLSGGAIGLFLFIAYIYQSYQNTEQSYEVAILSAFLFASFIVGISSAVYSFSAFALIPLYCMRFHKSETQSVKRGCIYIK